MEKLLKPYEKECMKMAILRHEEMFREQVHELHRLYRIQKMLMKNISSSRTHAQNQDSWSSHSRKENIYHNHINNSQDIHRQPHQKLDMERPAEENVAELDGNGGMEIEDEGEIELTLGPSSYYRRKKADTHTPLTSDSGLSFSSSSTSSSHLRSSGIHGSTDRRKEQLTDRKWGLVEVPNSNPSFLNGRRNSSDVEEQMRLQQPPWLFQVLSLNLT